MKAGFFLTVLLSFSIFMLGQNVSQDAVTGNWLTTKKDVKISIYKDNGKVHGKVVWGKKELGKDLKNPDPQKRSNSILGSVMLRDFKFNGKNKWEDGEIYDPTSGKTYSCTMKMTDANTLEIRGYIGISFFGRTEIWTRSL